MDCPHCNRFFRCPSEASEATPFQEGRAKPARSERNQAEVSLIAHELSFWRYQAIWHRAWILAGFKEPDDVDLKRAEAELERARQDENREQYAHAEPYREVGS